MISSWSICEKNILTWLTSATADHVDHDNNNEYYRDDDTNYGCAWYQRSLMMNHSCVYTLKDKNHVSDKYHDRKCTFVCLQSVSAEALLNDVWWWYKEKIIPSLKYIVLLLIISLCIQNKVWKVSCHIKDISNQVKN